MNPTPTPLERQELLRAYLLETLPDSFRAEVDAELASNEEWREDLERERTALSLLGRLPAEQAPQGLAQRTLAAIEEQAEKGTPRKRFPLNSLELTIVGSLAVALVIIILPLLGRARESASRASDQNNLKQLGVAFKTYAGEHNGQYPPLTPYPGVWMFDIRSVYPEFLTDLSPLVDPGHPEADKIWEKMQAALKRNPVDWETITRLAAQSYTYIGYAVDDPQELAALRDKLRQGAWGGLPKPFVTASGPLNPLKEGIERFFITDINNPAATARAQAQVPIMFNAYPEKPHPNKPGLSVLYMDGHVEFMRYGKAYPALPEVRKILTAP